MSFDNLVSAYTRTIRRLVLAALFLPSLVLGGPVDYQCIMKAGYKLNDDGTMTPAPKDSAFIGERFAVDRTTGRIVGGIFDNGSSDAEVRLVNRGSADGYAFEVFTKRRGRAELLMILEPRDVELKPFIGYALGGIFTGACR
jgi:hypothetical protein